MSTIKVAKIDNPCFTLTIELSYDEAVRLREWTGGTSTHSRAAANRGYKPVAGVDVSDPIIGLDGLIGNIYHALGDVL